MGLSGPFVWTSTFCLYLSKSFSESVLRILESSSNCFENVSLCFRRRSFSDVNCPSASVMDREAGRTNAIFFVGSELDFLSTGRSSSSSPVSFLLLVALLAAFSPTFTSVVSSTNDMSDESACDLQTRNSELPPIEVSASSSVTLDLGGAFSFPTYTSAELEWPGNLAYLLCLDCSCHCIVECLIYTMYEYIVVYVLVNQKTVASKR